jgi:hypothetical protein
MTITKKLSRCIKDSIKRKEDERNKQRIKDKKERQQKIKEIKEFFKELPRRQEFEFEGMPFYNNTSSSTVDKKTITIYKKFFTGEIVIYTNITVLLWIFGYGNDLKHIEYWNLESVRAMHKNLPWFEEQLRTRYGCES